MSKEKVIIENKYDTNYCCKYKNEKEINNYKELMKTKNSDIEIEINIEDELYRIDLLKIFKLEKYDDSIMAGIIEEIYNNFIENNQNTSIKRFRKILNKASQLFMTNDDKFGLVILFSFEYLDSAHKCICELIQTNTIGDDVLNKLDLELGIK